MSERQKTILTIAGSDSGGGAGIQIDCKTAERIGCFSTTVITALTAQNRKEVRDVMPVPLSFIESQFRTVVEDFEIDAVKVGMVGNAEVVKLVAELLWEYDLPNIVIDPVLIATSGGRLGSDGTAEAILEHFVPLATLLTPNQDEAEVLCVGEERVVVSGYRDCDEFYSLLRARGLRSLLMKGGHAESWQERGTITDRLYMGDEVFDFTAERLDIAEVLTHGTGCTLSSAIASYLALGHSLPEATGLGVSYVQERLRERM
ncbi:MAG: bifunctional hydroxymethylpyrimidine kinase/phosphomethylpyrimidine kinase [Rikenellaceae bacterium]